MMKMDTDQSGGGDDQTILTSLEWTDDEKAALTESIIADGRFLLPAGVNKHFHMIAINRRFYIATKKRVETRVLWDKLKELFDLAEVNSIINCPFPNERTEFSLPESDISQLIRDRESQSSQDKLMDEESSDSESGRETSPTLSITKRGAAVASTLTTSSDKTKYTLRWWNPI